MLQDINKILIIRPCAIGDFVQTLPAIRTLRNRYPNAYIEILGNLSTIVLAKNRFYANHINSFGQQDISFLFSKGPKFPQSLIDYLRDFDLAISYLNDDDHVFSNNLKKLGVKNSITYDPLPRINRYNIQPSLFDNPVKTRHIIDHILDPIISLGIDGSDLVKNPEIYVSADEKSFASEFLGNIRSQNNSHEKIVTIHPGSGSKKKNWPVERFNEVAQYLKENCGAKLLIVSGPADEDIVSSLSKNLDMSSIHVLKDIPLPSLAAILEQVNCFLGNDSGISNIAAAVGVPSVLIFGPTDPDVWAPRLKNVKVISSGYPCSPCQPGRMRNCENQKCLENVEVCDVIKHIKLFVLD